MEVGWPNYFLCVLMLQQVQKVLIGKNGSSIVICLFLTTRVCHAVDPFVFEGLVD